MRTAPATALSKDVTDLIDHIAARFRPAQIILFGSHAAGTADDGSDVDHIAAQFRPTQIILFGSHAAGTADDGSDVDLLVVTETNGRPLRRAAENYRSLSHHIPIDILVRSPEQIHDPSPGDLILTEIMKHGVTVYETGD